MKKLNTLLVSLALVLGLALPASAAWNVRNKDSGATVWVNPAGAEVPAGDSGLTLALPDIATASTKHVVSHKSGNIVKIYAVINGQIAGSNALLDFSVVALGGTIPRVVSGGSTLTITASGSVTGQVFSTTYTPGRQPGLAVLQGQAIAIHTDGGSSGPGDATITIVIE